VQSGGPIPFSSRAGPRALARSRPGPRSPRAADRPIPPVSDTAARYCAGPHVRRLSPALSPTERACAVHVAHPRRARAAAGAAHRSGPDPTSSHAPRGTPTPGTPSPLPFFPSRPRYRRAHSAARCSVRNPIFHPSPTTLSSTRAFLPLPAPGPPPPTTGARLSLANFSRPLLSSASPR
jgi:hypothetical protein